MKRIPFSPGRSLLLLVAMLALVLALAACVRPVPRDDEAAPTAVITDPVTETDPLPTPVVPETTDATPAPAEEPATEGTGETGETTEEPAAEPTAEPAAEPTAVPEPTGPPTEDVIHTVQAGETLYRISQQYNVTIQDIINANALADPNNLEVGQQLTIPGSESSGAAETPPDDGGEAATPPETTGEQTHVVQAGENLFRIGLRYGFTVEELASYNELADPTRLEVGQVIRIPPSE